VRYQYTVLPPSLPHIKHSGMHLRRLQPVAKSLRLSSVALAFFAMQHRSRSLSIPHAACETARASGPSTGMANNICRLPGASSQTQNKLSTSSCQHEWIRIQVSPRRRGLEASRARPRSHCGNENCSACKLAPIKDNARQFRPRS
jgi:hypothetical protein